jgi:lysophospholipase L1-like esterase
MSLMAIPRMTVPRMTVPRLLMVGVLMLGLLMAGMVVTDVSADTSPFGDDRGAIAAERIEKISRGRSVTIIGDSLVENRGKLHIAPFAERGVKATADGYSGRTLRRGWLCRVNGVRKVYPLPVGTRCGIQGLELIMRMKREGTLGSALVLALGTNDASVFPGEKTVRNLDAVRSMIGERHLWLVTVVRLKDKARATAWNQTATTWCARDVACSVVPWASLKVAWDPKIYAADGVHLLERGTKLRAEMIATVVVGP